MYDIWSCLDELHDRCWWIRKCDLVEDMFVFFCEVGLSVEVFCKRGASASYGFKICGARVASKCLSRGDEKEFAYDKGDCRGNVRVMFCMPEGARYVIIENQDVFVGVRDSEIPYLFEMAIPCCPIYEIGFVGCMCHTLDVEGISF
eukprot:scaffold178364_cov47-Attheya_sp.AAC.2